MGSYPSARSRTTTATDGGSRVALAMTGSR